MRYALGYARFREFIKQDREEKLKIIKLKEIDSTHNFAINMIENRSTFECGILADIQTNGVGRCGRKWTSAPGNLYASVIKKLPQSKDICKISLATECAVHKTVKNLLSPQKKDLLYLHWPNDIYYKNKKLSGILLAVIGDWIVISVGLNIRSVSVSTATSLDEVIDVSDVSAEKLFYSFLNNLDNEIDLLRTDSFSGIRKYWIQNIVGMNSEVTIRNGNDSLSGIVRGIDEFGRLILECNDKKLYISSGDMFVNEKKIVVNYGEKK